MREPIKVVETKSPVEHYRTFTPTTEQLIKLAEIFPLEHGGFYSHIGLTELVPNTATLKVFYYE